MATCTKFLFHVFDNFFSLWYWSHVNQSNLPLFPGDNDVLQGREAALAALKERVTICQKCDLHQERTKAVFGEGNVNSPDIAFVGEGPGFNEDQAGRPFVGRAGQLLDQMIEAMGYAREDVYICNVVCCRPPGNRRPQKEEADACNPFLAGQLHIVKPKVIVALGATAIQTLANSKKQLKDLRERWLEWKDKKSGLVVPLRATYHPAYLLRQPNKKSACWNDLQVVMQWAQRGD